MIRVSPRAHRTEDRAGDPLDGLVNLFDLGIVLSVGFLIAALSSLELADTLTDGQAARPDPVPSNAVTGPPGSSISSVPTTGVTVLGEGVEVGKVYRLEDGRVVVVVPPPAASGTRAPAAPSAGPTP